MLTMDRRRALFWWVAPLAIAAATALMATGCASSKAAKSALSARGMSSSPSASSSGMPGMNMGSSSGGMSGMSAGGVNPVPTQVLGTADWQGMKITAEAMTAVPFLIYNGTKMQMVKPPKNVSFHLMVTLIDAQTRVVIPYASVWATITRGNRTLFDESLWPMISRYMGPHYGNDVILDGVGTYKMTLLISPPVSARHVEYQNVWLTPHKVHFTFHWRSAS